MTVKILLTVVFGVLSGLFVFPETMVIHVDMFINTGLCILLFFVGIDIGRQKDILQKTKQLGFRIFLIPLMVAVGSIAGAIMGGFIFDLPFNEAGAIGAGFGWYTLSVIELSKHSPQLGTLAFMTNALREIIALIIIPLVAKYAGKLESIAPAGATAMDVTLPVISKSTDGNIAIISIITGISLSILAPLLIPLFMVL